MSWRPLYPRALCILWTLRCMFLYPRVRHSYKNTVAWEAEPRAKTRLPFEPHRLHSAPWGSSLGIWCPSLLSSVLFSPIRSFHLHFQNAHSALLARNTTLLFIWKLILRLHYLHFPRNCGGFLGEWLSFTGSQSLFSPESDGESIF